jgi:multimeric flavodoxin WrbA
LKAAADQRSTLLAAASRTSRSASSSLGDAARWPREHDPDIHSHAAAPRDGGGRPAVFRTAPDGLEEIKGGSPYGAPTITGGQGERMPSAQELGMSQCQGKHVASIAKKLFG